MSPAPPPEQKIHVITSIDKIDAADWAACATASGEKPEHPFLHYGFFKALEETGCVGEGTGWHPHHLILQRQNTTPRAIMPLYAKTHSQGEYVFDHAWAQAYTQAGLDYYPKWQSAIPFTPVTAPKFLVRDPEDETAIDLLLAGLKHLTHANQFSSAHLTFVPQEHLRYFGDDFLIRQDQQFHWQNNNYTDFDDFLAALAARKRKAIKKERAAVRDAGIEIIWQRGNDIAASDWDQFFNFYMDTGDRKWGTPYLNRAFFDALGTYLGDRVMLMIAQLDNTPVAATLNLVGHDTLYGRYWGCNRHVPFLHFELCYYQAIEFAIQNKLQTVEAGAQGDHKLARGYLSTPTYSAHYIARPDFRDAIKRFLVEEKAYIEDISEALNAHSPFKAPKD